MCAGATHAQRDECPGEGRKATGGPVSGGGSFIVIQEQETRYHASETRYQCAKQGTPTTRCKEQIQSNAEKASNLQPARKASLQGSRYSTCVHYVLFYCLVSCPLSQGSFPETTGLLARCMPIVPRLRPRHVTALGIPIATAEH